MLSQIVLSIPLGTLLLLSSYNICYNIFYRMKLLHEFLFSTVGYYASECNCVNDSACDGSEFDPTRVGRCVARHKARVETPTKVSFDN